MVFNSNISNTVSWSGNQTSVTVPACTTLKFTLTAKVSTIEVPFTVVLQKNDNTPSATYEGTYYKKMIIDSTVTYDKVSETPIEGCGTTTPASTVTLLAMA